MQPSTDPPARGRAANGPNDDGWVDQVADRVGALLKEEGLELELCVFYPPESEMLYAVGYDGSAQRYFHALERSGEPSGRGSPSAPNGTTQPI